MRKLFSWLDNNILGLLAGFLLVFIPLYPKWPLFDILYGYNVRVRLEDFFVAGMIILYGIWFLRRKFTIPKEITVVGLIGYLIIGLISCLVAIFLIQTVPLLVPHIEKTFLHWLRRVEYFSLFFIFLISIKSMKQARVYIFLFFVTLLAVIIYGYGQKYLYWPAFSTMNREFSKGWWLYLSEHARVLSTFGGHYDLAGYLVIALTMGWSLFFGIKKILWKVVMLLLIAGGFWLLILTASRISFAGYIIGLCVVVFFWMFKKSLGWGISRLFITVGLSMLIMLSFGDLSERFLRVIHLSDRVNSIRSILLNPTGAPPKNNAMFLQNNLAAVTSSSDVPPSTSKPGDINRDAPPLLIPIVTASGSATFVEKPRTYSSNAVMYDLSTGIRLDATWPRAIAGFKSDPLFGSGYATLTKTNKFEFTDAESTDSDYLRALGETGAFGFLFFFGSIISMAYVAWRSLGGIKDNFLYAIATGLIGLIAGLLVNATTIDIFEASKVAYVFWGISGIVMASLYISRKQIRDDWTPLKLKFNFSFKFLLTDRPWVILLLIFAFVLRMYKWDSPVADWHSWRQADTSAVSRNFEKAGTINWLYPTYDDISSVASGKPNPTGIRMVEFPIYNAATYFVKVLAGPEINIDEAGRITSALASILSILFIFLICRKLISRRVAYLSAITFSLIPYNIFYGRTILPDSTMVALSLGAIWFASQYLDFGKKKYYLLTVIFSTLALLAKPHAIFLLVSIGYFALVNFGKQRRRVILLVVSGLISLVPLVLWRMWIQNFPEGIPASSWLFNGNGIRFKGAFWYWLFADRIGRLILGYWGLVLLGFGLIKAKMFPLILFLGSLCYLAIIATGNVQHDYYQILIMPSLAILVGLGLDYLFSFNWRSRFLAIVSFLFMVAFGWYFIKDFYNINHPEIVEAGKKIRDLTQDEHRKALVIAPYDGDTAFLYQTNHQGWPIMEGSIEQMIQKGAGYYVSVKFDSLTNALINDSSGIRPKYKLIALTDKYVIIQLVPTNKLPK